MMLGYFHPAAGIPLFYVPDINFACIIIEAASFTRIYLYTQRPH